MQEFVFLLFEFIHFNQDKDDDKSEGEKDEDKTEDKEPEKPAEPPKKKVGLIHL